MRFTGMDKKRAFKIGHVVVLILLFLGSMNVNNLYFYFLFGAVTIGILMNGRRLRTDGMVIVLLLFSVCYIVFFPKVLETITTMLKQLLYPLCYLLGLNFIRREDMESEKLLEKRISMAIFVCSVGAFAHYILNMSINFTSLVRNNKDFWTGEIVSATGQAALAVLAVGVFSAWLFDTKKKKLVAAAGLILIMAYNLILAGRTLIMITVLVLCAAFIFAIRTTQSRRKVRLLSLLLLAIVFLLTMYMQNWFGIREFILGSNLSMRFDVMGLNQDQRLNNKLQYIVYMLDYPFGGDALRSKVGSYAHELYLDIYSNAGIFAYVLVIIFSVNSFLLAWRVTTKGAVSNDLRLLVLCVFFSMFVEFFLEPILQGMPWMFCSFCFFSGLLRNVQISRCSRGLQIKDVR